MKKMAIFLVIIVALFVLLGVFTNMKKEEKSKGNPYGKDKLKPATVDQLDDPNYQNLILPVELEQDLQDSKDVTVYFYSPTNSISQKPHQSWHLWQRNWVLILFNSIFWSLNKDGATMASKRPRPSFTIKMVKNKNESSALMMK